MPINLDEIMSRGRDTVEVLLIGGPRDGLRMEIRKDMSYITLDDEQGNPVRYDKIIVGSLDHWPDVVSLMKLESMSDFDAMTRLVKGYRRKPRAVRGPVSTSPQTFDPPEQQSSSLEAWDYEQLLNSLCHTLRNNTHESPVLQEREQTSDE